MLARDDDSVLSSSGPTDLDPAKARVILVNGRSWRKRLRNELLDYPRCDDNSTSVILPEPCNCKTSMCYPIEE